MELVLYFVCILFGGFCLKLAAEYFIEGKYFWFGIHTTNAVAMAGNIIKILMH